MTLEPNYGNFLHRDLLVDTGGEGNIIDVFLEFETDEEAPAQATVGPVEAEAPTDNLCRRTIPLPGKERVVIGALQVNEEPAPLCQAAEAAALAAYGSLVQRPVPRRTHQFDRASVANLNACELLSTDEVRTALGDAPTPEPGFANWSCYWSIDEDHQIEIMFGREWPLANDPLQGTRTRIGGRVAFVNAFDDLCRVTVAQRRYTLVDASPEGTRPQRDETIEVSLVDPDVDAPESLCPAVTQLAEGLVDRLPD